MAKVNVNGKSLSTQQSVNQTIYAICDIMRRSGRAGALQYVPELTWILFLRILDERENDEARKNSIMGLPFTPSIVAPYRWRDWAAPDSEQRKTLQEGRSGALEDFLVKKLFPYLHGLEKQPDATPRQRVISEVMSSVTQFNLDSEYNMWEVIDRVHQIHDDAIDTTHIFPLSQVFEGLLLRMGEKNNDGGQFFTPREVIRAMVKALEPQIGKTVYDPCCGTGGFLAQAYEYMRGQVRTGRDLELLKHETFYGREKDEIIYPIGLANLMLHGIDQPNLWHGNTLTGRVVYDGLFKQVPAQFDYILTNPPFGGKENTQAQSNFDFKTSATQVLFLQHVIDKLSDDGGKCGIVLDEGVLFRTNDKAFMQTKRKLLNECTVWCILSLPGGVFTQAGAGVKTNLLFFTKGESTETIWYYDLSHLKIRKRTPLTLTHFEHFFQLLPSRVDSPYSWKVNISERKQKADAEAAPYRKQAQEKERAANQLQEQLKALPKTQDISAAQTIQAAIYELQKEAREFSKRAQAIEDTVYDLKAVNPNSQDEEESLTPAQLIEIIEVKGREVMAALAELKGIG